jgi:hypothetical protein
MAVSLQPTWTQDLSRSFAHIEKAVTKQPVLVAAFFVLWAFISMLDWYDMPFPSFFAKLASMVILLFLAAGLIRETFNDGQDDETKQRLTWQQSGTPILTLVLVQVIFFTVLTVLFLMLLAPGVWWATTSCLAIVVAVIEDKGAVDAIKRSHQLVKGDFVRTVTFMLPAVLLSAILMGGMGYLADYGLSFLQRQEYAPVVLLASALIFGLLKSAFWLMSNLVIFTYLTRLFIRLTGKQAEPKDQ